jgi:WD40 repeat protein
MIALALLCVTSLKVAMTLSTATMLSAPVAAPLNTLCAYDERITGGIETNAVEPQFVLSAHSKPVTALAFSPRGSIMASGSADHSVAIWDLRRRVQVAVFRGHDGPVYALQFSPDGSLLASSALDGSLVLWDLKEKKVLTRIQEQNPYSLQIAFSPDGRRVTSSSRVVSDIASEVTEWDVKSGQRLNTIEYNGEPVLSVAYSPSGEYLASTGVDGYLVLSNLRSANRRVIRANYAEGMGVCFSQDGRRVFTGGRDGYLSAWTVADGRHLLRFKAHRISVTSLGLTRDGNYIVSSGCCGVNKTDQAFEITIWSATTGQCIRRIARGPCGYYRVSLSPIKDLVAAGCSDGNVRVWGLPREGGRR